MLCKFCSFIDFLVLANIFQSCGFETVYRWLPLSVSLSAVKYPCFSWWQSISYESAAAAAAVVTQYTQGWCHTVVTAISGRLNFIQLNLWELSMSCAGNKSLVLSCNDFSDMNSTQWLFGAHYKCSYLNMADDYIQNLRHKLSHSNYACCWIHTEYLYVIRIFGFGLSHLLVVMSGSLIFLF